ncbi:hypothetical protein PQQ96_21815 [Paraburkholderia sediminicola]|uniref:hypothetical protein n=1 Tax=Paraburkholderia sediminicola TaxID=458836 RepID=UPI0038BDE616
MSERTLNAGQVASLLVSTSCGIGFLLGTGELALHQGMAACLYAIASALGLIALAACARALSIGRQSPWASFEQLYGASVSRSVALLSLIWMTGVLATQIRGGYAILTLAGLRPTLALLLIDGILIGLSLMRLSWLAAGFAICMLACNVVLVRTLFEMNGFAVWLNAPIEFLDGLRTMPPVHTALTVISVVVMVVCGADYQQFVVAARATATARAGCLLAAALVFVIGFLPASAVIAAAPVWHLEHLMDPIQIVPIVLMRTFSSDAVSSTGGFIVAMLGLTALGAGCSILRAMADAATTLGQPSSTAPIWSRVLPVTLGSLVATREQSLVDMMIDLNTVYISSVGPLLLFSLTRTSVSHTTAKATVAAGFGITMVCYLIRWTGATLIPDATSLLVPLTLSLVVTLGVRRNNAISVSKSNPVCDPHQTTTPLGTQSPSMPTPSLSGDADDS